MNKLRIFTIVLHCLVISFVFITAELHSKQSDSTDSDKESLIDILAEVTAQADNQSPPDDEIKID